MDQKSADGIVRTSIRAMALFNQLARELQDSLPDDEFKLQRREIGKIMGSISLDLLNPVTPHCSYADVDSDVGWEAAGMLFEPNWLKRIE